MKGIEIVYEVSNEEYEKIFKNSCIFADIVDCSANNTILECIKFNTPIILRRSKAAEEYLGENYPLFFDNPEELIVLNEEIFMLDLIVKAHYYLKNMNKHHIELNTFNKKIEYDLSKLSITKKYETKLIWVSFIRSKDILEIEKFLRTFVTQQNREDLSLLLFMSFDNDIAKYYTNLYNNITIVRLSDGDTELSFLQQIKMMEPYINAQYVSIMDITTIYKINFSKTFISYLENTPSCDIGVCNYTVIKNNKDEFIDKIFTKDELFTNPNEENTSAVWRSDCLSLINLDTLGENMNEFYFWSHCLNNHLNMMCVSDKLLYSISV